MTARRIPHTRHGAGHQPLSAVVYSACLVLAASWYALEALHVTIASPPPLPTDRTARITLYFEYVRTTVPQQCVALLIVSAGFAALYVLAERAISIVDLSWPAHLCRLGATLFITAQLIQFGGYRHVSQTSLNAGRDLTADLITLQVIDAIDDALELGAFALVGVGMLGLGIAARHAPATRTWSRWSTLSGLLHLALAGAIALAAWNVVDVLLIAGGTIAAPIWAFTLTHVTATRDTQPARPLRS